MVTDVVNEPLLRWIPLLPLLSAGLHGLWLVARRRPVARSVLVVSCCGASILSAGLVCLAFARLLRLPEGKGQLLDVVYTWFGAGIGPAAFSADVAFRLDPLSGVLALLVAGIGVTVHLCAVDDSLQEAPDAWREQRIFAVLNLLLAASLTVILADGLVLMFAGWEAVALASALFVAFGDADGDPAHAAPQLLRVDCLGAVGFTVAFFLLFWSSSSAGAPLLSLRGLEASLAAVAQQTLPLPGGDGQRTIPLVDVVGLCFLVTVLARSAQVPLHGWLPRAAAASPPAAAFMLSSATLAGGVYLLARLGPLYALAPLASAAVAWIGGVTALLAAGSSLGQTGCKRLVACVVTSQFGAVLVAAGAGGAAAALPLLVNVCFATALLTLVVGALSAALRGERDVTRMGGLETRLPKLRVVTLIAVLTLAGFPGLSGFFGRESTGALLLESEWPGARVLYGLGVVTALLISGSLFRLYFLVFRGDSRVEREVRAHLREPAAAGLQPLYALCVFCVLGGLMALPQFWGDLIGIEDSNSLGHFVAASRPAARAASLVSGFEGAVVAVAVGTWAAGALAVWWAFVRARARTDAFHERFPAAVGWLRLSLGSQALYEQTLARPLARFADRVSYRAVDRGLLERFALDGVARAVASLANDALKFPQSGMVQGYGVLVLAAVLLLLWVLVG